MRHMSFALTTPQIVNQTKTVTRRVGWVRLKADTLLQPIEQGQGLKKGEHVQVIGAPIRVVSVRREPLSRMRDSVAYGIEECQREGFGAHPDLMWPSSFVEYFAAGHDCDVDDDITRIEFEYTVTLEAQAFDFEVHHAPHLHRRAGEEFARQASDDPQLEWLLCPSCGEMTLVRSLDIELSAAAAADAVARAFEQRMSR